MQKLLKLIIPMIVILALLSGCGQIDITEEDIATLTTITSSLDGTVEYVNGRTCRVCVTEGDSHFEEDDVIQVTFTNLEGSKSLQVGDAVRVEYVYASQVSEYQNSPHITVNQLYVE